LSIRLSFWTPRDPFAGDYIEKAADGLAEITKQP
jgi:hypothetical protein